MKLVRYGRAGAEKPGADRRGRQPARSLARWSRTSPRRRCRPPGSSACARRSPSACPLVKGKPAARLPARRHRQDRLHRPQLHRSRGGGEAWRCPKEPTIFIKANSAISGPDDPIARPRGAVKLDYEVELVRGDRPRRAPRRTRAARSGYVAAYCLMNDVSEREFQMEHGGGDHQGQERGHLRAHRALAGHRGRDRAIRRRSGSGPPSTASGASTGSTAGHGLPGAPARRLREPLHVAASRATCSPPARPPGWATGPGRRATSTPATWSRWGSTASGPSGTG